ncbi:MAG TPA: hypothetical protein VK715_05990, partial [Steroidobacteraceae bacterium]|nr:hypothetical protein [Steroidobacteraceae bacterium]
RIGCARDWNRSWQQRDTEITEMPQFHCSYYAHQVWKDNLQRLIRNRKFRVNFRTSAVILYQREKAEKAVTNLSGKTVLYGSQVRDMA